MDFKRSVQIVAITLTTFFCLSAFSAYDNTWHQAPFWSGEYPNGISVMREKVSLPARTGMDRDLPLSILCGVSFKAVYHPWNTARPAKYFTAAKIVPMIAKDDFKYETGEGAILSIRKGDVIEHLIYYAEGQFAIRFKGQEYTADHGLLEKVTYDEALMETPQDEWLKIDCADGTAAWVYLRDLYYTHPNGHTLYLPGLDTWFWGFREYGVVTDLTDADLKKRK